MTQEFQGNPSTQAKKNRCLLMDWGDTLMRNFIQFNGPMVTWPKVEALPFASQALQQLYPAWLLALATNAPDSKEVEIWAALQRADLDQWIDCIYCYHNIGFKKPSSQFFQAVLADLTLEPSQVVMLGDDFETDILGAIQAGLWALWLNEKSSEEKISTKYTTIHSLAELPKAIYSLVGDSQY